MGWQVPLSPERLMDQQRTRIDEFILKKNSEAVLSLEHQVLGFLFCFCLLSFSLCVILKHIAWKFLCCEISYVKSLAGAKFFLPPPA